MSRTFHGHLAPRITLVATLAALAIPTILITGVLPAVLAQTHV